MEELSAEVWIVRVKGQFAPGEEALVEIDLLGHDFYVYTDRDTNEVQVLYRKNGGYGLLKPKHANSKRTVVASRFEASRRPTLRHLPPTGFHLTLPQLSAACNLLDRKEGFGPPSAISVQCRLARCRSGMPALKHRPWFAWKWRRATTFTGMPRLQEFRSRR